MPVPVRAWPSTSTPASARGMMPACTGVGSAYAARSSAASIVSRAPNRAKPGTRCGGIGCSIYQKREPRQGRDRRFGGSAIGPSGYRRIQAGRAVEGIEVDCRALHPSANSTDRLKKQTGWPCVEARSQPVVIVVSRAQVDSEVEPVGLEAGRRTAGPEPRRAAAWSPASWWTASWPTSWRPSSSGIASWSTSWPPSSWWTVLGRLLGGLSLLCHRIWLLPLQRPCHFTVGLSPGALTAGERHPPNERQWPAAARTAELAAMANRQRIR